MKSKFKRGYFLTVVSTALLLIATGTPHAGETTRVSVSSAGVQGNDDSYFAAISADGRFVAFGSSATNLVGGDTNRKGDAFVHDRQTHQTTRVSVNSAGAQGNDFSSPSTISADGRYVEFYSSATNLVVGDTNNESDIFVHDRQTQQTTRVSVSSTGIQGNDSSYSATISADGRFVAFVSDATNLASGDTNGRSDAFVHNLQTHETTRVSVNSEGTQGNDTSSPTAISGDGRFVVFDSFATNLVFGDTNNESDIFVHDRQTHETKRVSVSSTGMQGNDYSYSATISADGRFVPFFSPATNLVSGDTNGASDAFVHDRKTHQTTRVSISSTGTQGNRFSYDPAISADGRFVVFGSDATNLVAEDTNDTLDAFVHDRQTHKTTRVSVNSDGAQGNQLSETYAISANGRFVVFQSYATNLVAGDTNGKVDTFVHDRLEAVAPKNVVLLLHGINAIPATWNSLVTKYFPRGCSAIYDGAIGTVVTPNTRNTYCYRIKFGAFDAHSPNKGLEDAWDYGEINGYPSAGDYSTFNQLGSEINKAITAIKNKLPGARILLIGHSRGGLAARAFLQNPSFTVNKSSVVGLITTGTPHNGTPIGRVYNYIQDRLFKPDGFTRQTDLDSAKDWRAIDFLSGKLDCNAVAGNLGFQIDTRRPVIGYLSDFPGFGSLIPGLNDNRGNLPAIRYGEIIYNGVRLGRLAGTGGAFYHLFDEPGYADICRQVSKRAERIIKGVGESDPVPPSTNYPGDGIVTADSQGATFFPTVKKKPYSTSVLHTMEPGQYRHIADITCQIGLPWLESCVTSAQILAMEQTQASFISPEGVSHDYEALVALKTEQIWQDWLAVISDDAKANQREHFAVALGMKLRDTDNPSFYADIEQRLLNIDAPLLDRARFAGLLAEIATPSALKVLTDALLNPDCSAIQTALSNAILGVADSLAEQPRRSDLSAVLQSAWTIPKQTQLQLNILALALAKLGTPQNVELLLTAIETMGAYIPKINKEPLNDIKQQAMAAYLAMDSIINPDSEAVLSSAFMNHRATEAVFVAAGTGLVNLGTEDAAQQVLQRLDELPDRAVPIGQQWLTSLSGKIDKAALRNMNKTLGLPKQPLLRKQIDEILQ